MMPASADSLAVITADPAEPSFGTMIERVRLVAMRDGKPFARAAMPWAGWNRLIASAAMVVSAHAIGKMTVTFELSRREDAMSENPRAAAALRLGYSDKGLLVIEFLDAGGAVFALAALTADEMSQFVGQSCDLLEIVAKGGLATVECAGAA